MRGAKTGSWDSRRKPQLSLSFRCERQWAELGNQKGGTAPGPLVSGPVLGHLKQLKGFIYGGCFKNRGNIGYKIDHFIYL